jgi:hypothetical protein
MRMEQLLMRTFDFVWGAALAIAVALLAAVCSPAQAGWIEGRSRDTFPPAYRGVWCSIGNDLFVKAKNERSCPNRSGDFIYKIIATGYRLEEDNCQVTRITGDKAGDPNPRSIAVKVYCNGGIDPENSVRTGEMRIEGGKLRVRWNSETER